MKIKKILFEEKKAASVEDKADDNQQRRLGTYAGLMLSESSTKALKFFCQDHEVPNPTDPAVYHVTLLHSKKYLDDYDAAGILERPYIGYNLKADIWDTKSGERALVVKFECPDLVTRHNELMDDHEAEYDYDEYIPHVTISYDIEDWNTNLDKLDYALNKYVETIELVEEYEEALELDWSKKNGKKSDK